MIYELTWRPQAKDEFDEAYDWHETQRAGLGDAFAKEVHESLELLKRNPKIHAKEYHEIRKSVLKRFPYSIYYYIEDKTVVVLSIFHGKRNPDEWKSRT